MLRYAKSARRLSLMLSDRPTASNGGGANALFNYLLSLSTKVRTQKGYVISKVFQDSRYFTLFPARHLSFIHFYSLPQFLFIPLVLLTILSV